MIGDVSIGGFSTCCAVTTSGRVAMGACSIALSPLSVGTGRTATQYRPAAVSGLSGGIPAMRSSG